MDISNLWVPGLKPIASTTPSTGLNTRPAKSSATPRSCPRTTWSPTPTRVPLVASTSMSTRFRSWLSLTTPTVFLELDSRGLSDLRRDLGVIHHTAEQLSTGPEGEEGYRVAGVAALRWALDLDCRRHDAGVHPRGEHFAHCVSSHVRRLPEHRLCQPDISAISASVMSITLAKSASTLRMLSGSNAFPSAAAV